ncbi:MAG: hypothetical protein F4Z54_07885 [Acidimicrobiaceae bacterium]|nr:hypothetical protein [Acidimicrobiaceae bacterium]
MRTPVVVLPVLTGKQALAWDALMAVTADLGEGWTLIGGQMVLLHQAERRPAGADPASGASLRWSYDLDVVVNLRTNRTRMSHIDSVLRDHGFDQQILPIGHRYVDAAGTVFDVLAPDHLGRHLPRLGRGNTLQAAGGTQALKRSGRVEVERNQQRALIPRPDLVGALLIKIAAAAGPPGGRGNRRHLLDVMTLAALITPQDAANAALTRQEGKRIRLAAQNLARDGSGPARTAAQSLTLLVPTPSVDNNTGHDTPNRSGSLGRSSS